MILTLVAGAPTNHQNSVYQQVFPLLRTDQNEQDSSPQLLVEDSSTYDPTSHNQKVNSLFNISKASKVQLNLCIQGLQDEAQSPPHHIKDMHHKNVAHIENLLSRHAYSSGPIQKKEIKEKGKREFMQYSLILRVCRNNNQLSYVCSAETSPKRYT